MIGYDCRQPISLNVLQYSIYTNSSKPVAITPLVLDQLPLERQGLTPFTYSRFLVPYLCNYEGWALFLDLDMLAVCDIAEIFALADDRYSVMVSKNVKQFEWSSLMLFNCAKCKVLTPKYIEKADRLHCIDWAKPEEIGGIPGKYNHLVGYDAPREDASLIHYTQGVPAFPETKDSEHAKLWMEYHVKGNSAQPWTTLMGNSVHAKELNGKRVPKYTVEQPNEKQAS